MSNTFRFSPIKNKEDLMKAIEYVHFTCIKLTKKAFGRYLPVSGNLGVFTHFQDEFELLTKFREELTDKNINWNQKYFKLHEPITITDQRGDIPETTYNYLYVRRPDEEKPQVGDVDFVLEKDEFEKYKKLAMEKTLINEVELFYRPDLDMIRLSHPDFDALPYITTKYIEENVKT